MYQKLLFIIRQYHYFLQKATVIALIFFSLSVLLNPQRFACNYSYIQDDDIVNSLRVYPFALQQSQLTSKPLCSFTFNSSYSDLYYPATNIDWLTLMTLAKALNVSNGGEWKPRECTPKFQVAIIIPLRNRTEQLKVFLGFMHPFLQKQMLHYRIFVVEQSPLGEFNRAKLFNIGYTEAMKFHSFHCFIFHDVDLIPQNINNIYACTRDPRHMSSSVNTFRYNLPYEDLFGGAISILQKQFELVNGFSNSFFGWGGEDDDFHGRIKSKNLHVCRFSPSVARYFMLAHPKEVPSENRFLNLRLGKDRIDIDGLNTLTYKLIKIELKPLYTSVLADL